MQDVEVYLNPKRTPEMWSNLINDFGIGAFNVAQADGTLFEPPRIHLAAEIMLFDHRTLFHEIQHARQDMACEYPITNFLGSEYETLPHEIDAKTEEARRITQFGIFF